MKRKNSGITLIALIITIIIMLILAGVTISILSGSDGLLAKAEKAVSETEKAAMQEDAELAIATIKMEYYEDYASNKNMTAKEFIVAKLAEPYETARGATMEADAEGNITYTLDGVSTKLTIDENGKVTFGESSGATGGENVGEKYYGDSSVVPTDAKYFTFTINEDGQTATITGVKDEYADLTYYKDNTGTIWDNISIPCAINDNGTYITEVVIPYEYVDENNNKYIVTAIGKSAFGADGEYTTGTVGWRAMYEEKENSFTGFLFPNTITTIGELAFAGQPKLSKVDILYGTTNIEKMAFRNCRKLISVNIANSVTTIGDQAFESCESLSNINIPDSVTSIGSKVFYRCDCLKELNVNNEVYSSQDGIIYDRQKENIIAVPGGIMGEITIPNGVTSIGSEAFNCCTSLSSVNIGNGVMSIGDAVFAGCTSLSSINIPESVTTIGQGVFYECTSLSSINIPESVTTIGQRAFHYWTEIQTINCEAVSKPSGWNSQWNSDCNATVNWGVSM